MLTEHFIASVGVPSKAPGNNVAKDAAIFVHEFQPLQAQRAVFKKSATLPNCLAVSPLHIFAAQAEKAVVHVYSREKGNQEATIPFTERISCITLACDETILILGTAEGKIFLWETATGRQVTTAQSHLQAITALAVDPTSNFLLSSSKDSTVHVWSIPSLLSFSNAGGQPLTPIRTFSSHRSEITALSLGHSFSLCNIAVSAAKDKTCLIWDYHTNGVLRTYLLPHVPTCLALDPIDRAIYVGYEDGSLQQLDLHVFKSSVRSAQDVATPIQPRSSSQWRLPDSSCGATSSISVSFDGCTVISGHGSGAIIAWDASRGGLPTTLLQTPLPGPVNGLMFLPVQGFAREKCRTLGVRTVIKPKFGAFDTANDAVPSNYALHAELSSKLSHTSSAFERALTAGAFPAKVMDDGLSELYNWGQKSQAIQGQHDEHDEDFMALDNGQEQSNVLSLEEQNAALQSELDALRRLQRASFEKIERMNVEKKALVEREQKRLKLAAPNGKPAKINGSHTAELDMNEYDSSEDED